MHERIAERVGTLAQAIRAKDIDALMAHYAPDVIVFDLRPPLRVEGSTAYRRNFEAWFAGVEGAIEFDVEHLEMAGAGDAAFCHYVAHVRFAAREGGAIDYHVRVTAGWREANGRWLIMHEHISVALPPELMREAIQGSARRPHTLPAGE